MTTDISRERVQLQLPELVSNELSGPVVEFLLTYEFSGPDLGFGPGWRPSLASYDFATRTLRYGQGEMVLDVPAETPDVHLAQSGDSLRLTYTNGQTDMLSPAEGPETALVSKTIAPSGHSVSYTYSAEGQLTGITDDSQQQLVRIERSSDQIRIVYTASAGVTTFTLALHEGLLTEVVPPGEDSASWAFTYQDGQLATSRSPLNEVSAYGEGKLASVRTPDGTVVTYQDGKPITVRHPDGTVTAVPSHSSRVPPAVEEDTSFPEGA
ncbi:hypothetical protein ACH475_34115 [Streptomyces globisporus]|uniref:hypothetical protein n=1 Tax=Streptomyces globisporus TaxID=1908 RepID=UPI0037B14306